MITRWNSQLKDIEKWCHEEMTENPTKTNRLLYCLANVVKDLEEHLLGKKKKARR